MRVQRYYRRQFAESPKKQVLMCNPNAVMKWISNWSFESDTLEVHTDLGVFLIKLWLDSSGPALILHNPPLIHNPQ